MAPIIWDCWRILLIDFKERNAIVNAEYYVTLLTANEMPSKRKGRGSWAKVVGLFITMASRDHCERLQIPRMLPITLHPDWIFSNFYLFSKLKSDWRRKFLTEQSSELQWKKIFLTKKAIIFFIGTKMLSKHCIKFEVRGEYIENQWNPFFFHLSSFLWLELMDLIFKSINQGNSKCNHTASMHIHTEKRQE